MRISKCLGLLLLVVIGGVFASAAMGLEVINSIPMQPVNNEIQYVSDEFIVVLNEASGTPGPTDYSELGESGIPSLDLLAQSYTVEYLKPQFPGAAARGITGLSQYYKVRFSNRHDLQDVMASYAGDPNVDRVEPIGIHPLYAVPNDGFYGDQWHLNQTNDHDIDAPEAWNIAYGNPSVIVAILDTGVRYYHKDLGGVNASDSNPGAARGNMWINTAELNGSSGVDDDGNGYTDDWVGYDFVDGGSSCWSGEDCYTKDNDPRDFNGHGTHCAGIVSAINNNGYATASPSGGWGNGSLQETGNGVKILACRVGWSGSYGPQEVGYVRMDFCAEAFYYAADNGATIASCSWGSSNSGGIDSAVDYFTGNGGLVFKAAGNDGGQTADYLCGRSDVISVAATDANDCKAGFSTYGTWVDISAPGVDIMSLYHDHGNPSSDYVATMSGTSMATPLAASVAALIWSYNPGWSASQVEQQLYDSADDIYGLSCNSSYAGKLGAGRVNAFNAISGGTPPPVAEFTADLTSGCLPLTVSFTDLSTGDITSWNWDFGDGATSTAQNPAHSYTVAGNYTVSLTVTGPGGVDTETKTDYIAVSDLPVADFNGSPTTGTAPLTVQFNDLSTGNPTSWSWVFGDGGTSTEQNPAYQYTAEGDYTVTLTVENGCGSDVVTKTGYIHVDPPSPSTVALSDIPVAGTVTGNYTATHTSNNVYEVITEVSSQTHPRKWYSMLEHRWDFNVMAGTSVTFTVEAYRPSNSDGDDFAFEYSPDGNSFTTLVTIASGTEQTYSASLPSNLSGTVYIRVIDTDHTRENQSLDPVYIDYMVIESSTTPMPPVAGFSGTPTSGSVPLTVQFTDQSSYAPTSWNWNFGDGNSSVAQNPVYEYTAIGTYTVSLTATNAYGADTETKVDYITVTEVQTGTMHVHDLVVTRKIAGPNHSGIADILIYDETESPVAGATVSAVATGPVGGSFTGVTLADGSVRFQTGKTRNPSGEWCFEVTDMTHASLTYNPAANHVTMACESGVVYDESGIERVQALSFGLDQHEQVMEGGTRIIRFHLEEDARVQLDIFTVTGRRIATLVDDWRSAGSHSAQFNTSTLSSGIYFYRLKSQKVVDTKKFLILK